MDANYKKKVGGDMEEGEINSTDIAGNYDEDWI